MLEVTYLKRIVPIEKEIKLFAGAISDIDSFRLIKRYFKMYSRVRDPFSDARIYVSDRWYHPFDRSTLREFDSLVAQYITFGYQPEISDCDDFSNAVRYSQVLLNVDHNKNFLVGEIWFKDLDRHFVHAMNFLMYKEGFRRYVIKMYEPQQVSRRGTGVLDMDWWASTRKKIILIQY